VNSERVTDSRRLRNGDVVQFGNGQCRWRFLLPQADSDTAVWQPVEGTAAAAFALNGTRVEQVVLLADKLAISRHAPAEGACHLVEPALPVPTVELAWQRRGLTVSAASGAMFLDGELIDGENAGRPLRVPAELAIHSDDDGPTLLAQGLFHGVAASVHLRLLATAGALSLSRREISRP
jgi:hypothetical protein